MIVPNKPLWPSQLRPEIASRPSREADIEGAGITPLEYNVLVKPEPIEEKTAGGLIKPEDTLEREVHAAQKATVIALAEKAYVEIADAVIPKPGQQVFMVRYSGTEVEGADGEKYRLVKDKSILAVME